MNVHFSSKTPEWSTPQDVFDKLNTEFSFTLDPAATKNNAKCARFYTEKEDGLAQDWKGERVFCNPPYGRVIGRWVEKMATGGGRRLGRTIARSNGYALVPRTHSRESRNTIHQRTIEIRRLREQCALPFNDRHLE